MPDLLECRGLTKTYGPSTVLDDVGLTLRAGEALAVLGENGAGKSSLMKIIAGLTPHGTYEGTVKLGGTAAEFGSVRAGEDAGVVMVPQELHVVPHLTIAENMFVAELPGRFGMYDRRAAEEQAREALRIFDMDIDPRSKAQALSPSERRLIVLASALHRSAKVLILDEPTAALTEAESAVLLDHVAAVRESGVGILYITHRLDELDRVAQRSIVLRNGKLVSEFESLPVRSKLVSAMLGAELESVEPLAETGRAPSRAGQPVLRVRNLTVASNDKVRPPRVVDASLDVHPGEIVGLYGLVGAGRTELGQAIFGAWPGHVGGECEIAGVTGLPRNTMQAIRRGLTLLVEDRKSQGVIGGHDVATNLNASMIEQHSRGWLFVDQGRERRRAKDLIAKLGVRPPRADSQMTALSGGNQQKVLLGRCLIDGLKVLILDEPTIGVDVGARRDIYELIRTFARDLGVGVLLISSDVDEVRTECDRVLVMYKGCITGEFPGAAGAHELLSAATGA
ncbi:MULTISPECIES: sugar ABC transporter ATP-binding protein [unclassified Mycolicibacterium]|uniref:sugar ABC transporter ATP-binding protein n=1 Tax=unclassified Mycolicibacterium TaxID=2636767 RepID=UPI002EDABA04